MKRYLITKLLLIGMGFASNGSFLFHNPPAEAQAGKPIILSVTPISDYHVLEAKGYFRKKGNLNFQETHLKKNGVSWQMIIQGRNLSIDGLEYCFVFKMSDGGMLAFPEGDPFENPHSVNVSPMVVPDVNIPGDEPEVLQGIISADILVLSPDPGSVINPDDLVIAASLFNVPDVDSTSIRLFLDKQDVTIHTEISGGVITYIPNQIKKGNHSVLLTLSTNSGETIKPAKWEFNIAGGFKVVSELNYHADITSRFYSEYVGNEFLNVGELNGSANAQLEFAKFNADFRRTSRENPYQQPLNRFSATMQFGSYLDIRVGDFYRSVTPYTLDGRRVRGFNLDLDLKYVRLEVVKGQLNRAVQHSNKIDGALKINPNGSKMDSTGSVLFALDRTGYTFERDIFLTRLSVDLFSKYQMGIHFLKAIDDINSLDKNVAGAEFTIDSSSIIVNDSLYDLQVGQYSYDSFTNAVNELGGDVLLPEKNWGGRAPEDNLVFGFDLGTLRDKKRLKFESSWNMSLYNRDIWDGVMTRTQLDTSLDDTLDGFIGTFYDENGLVTEGSILIDTNDVLDPLLFKDIFTMNINMLPLIPIDVSTVKKHPILSVVNMPSSAFHLRLLGNYRANKFTVEYRQIGPEFVSLANPYLTNNIREFVLSDRLALVENKIMISVTYKYRDNKILNTVEQPLKTNSFIASLTFMPGPNAPSYVVNFQSIGKNNSKTELEKVGNNWKDLREESRTNNSFFSITYPFSTGNIKHNLNINLNSISNKDLLANDRKKDYFFQKSDSKTISVALSTRFSIPLRSIANFNRTSILVPVQDTEGNISTNELTWLAVGLNGNYALWNNKLKVTSGLSYLSNKGTTPISLYGLKAGAELNVLKGLNVSLSGSFQIRSDDTISLNTSGIMFTIRYNFR